MAASPKTLIFFLFFCSVVLPGMSKPAETVNTIQTEEITYQIGDQSFTGFYAYDASVKEKRPGVLVVHEWWGHNQHARNRAIMLAKAGYPAFALDMYGSGKLAAHPQDAETFMNEAMASAEIIPQRFDRALEWLKQQHQVDADKLAAIGYCFGGAVVLNMARAGKELDAVASFHGVLAPKVKAVPGQVKTKVAVFNGADDPYVPPEQVAAFENEMHEAGIDYTLKNYPGVVHSFTNPEANANGEAFQMPLKYDEAADKDSWQGMLDVFRDAFQ